MKTILFFTTALFFLTTHLFGQVDIGKLPGKWFLCGDADLILSDTTTYSRIETKCESVNCSRHEWYFKENNVVTYSWGTSCGDSFFNQCLNTNKWSIENKTVLFITTKEGKVFKYKLLRLDETTLTIMKE